MPRPRDHLIPHYVAYIRSKSSLATLDKHYSCLKLAAHLFAVAQQLAEDGHDLELRRPPRHRIDSLEHLEKLLSELPDLAGKDLYWRLIQAISTIESVRCLREDEGFCGKPVRIEPFELKGGHALGGHVVYWVRRPGSFRSLRLGQFEAARESGKKVPPAPLESPSRHLERLVCHWIRGNTNVVRATPPDPTAPLISESGRHLERGEPYRIALCPLVGRAHPKFQLVESDTRFWTYPDQPMVAEAGHSVQEQLEEILTACRSDGIHLLILPELMLDAAARVWLCENLRRTNSELPYGVVAGSLHIGYLSRPRNESLLLDHSGRPVLCHHKRGRFSIKRQAVEPLCENGFFHDAAWLLARLDQLPDEIPEHIEPGESISLLETSLGQITVLICADAIDDERRPELHQEVASLRPDFVLLPTMSPETDRFDEFATRMERLGVSTLFVNAGCVCSENETLALFCLSLYEEADGPATRVRWRGRELEQWVRSPKPGGWAPIADRGAAVDWLEGTGSQPIGLVVDLHAFRR